MVLGAPGGCLGAILVPRAPRTEKDRKSDFMDPPQGARLGARMEPNFIFIQFVSELFGYRVCDWICTLKTYQKATKNVTKWRKKQCKDESPKALRETLVSASFFNGFVMCFCLFFYLVFLSSCIGSRNSTKPENCHSVNRTNIFANRSGCVLQAFHNWSVLFFSAFDGVFRILFCIDFLWF